MAKPSAIDTLHIDTMLLRGAEYGFFPINVDCMKSDAAAIIEAYTKVGWLVQPTSRTDAEDFSIVLQFTPSAWPGACDAANWPGARDAADNKPL